MDLKKAENAIIELENQSKRLSKFSELIEEFKKMCGELNLLPTAFGKESQDSIKKIEKKNIAAAEKLEKIYQDLQLIPGVIEKENFASIYRIEKKNIAASEKLEKIYQDLQLIPSIVEKSLNDSNKNLNEVSKKIDDIYNKTEKTISELSLQVSNNVQKTTDLSLRIIDTEKNILANNKVLDDGIKSLSDRMQIIMKKSTEQYKNLIILHLVSVAIVFIVLYNLGKL
jgi:hypothetical protein